ncbi:acyl-CoA thioesterase [Striga asiatica]|uniref:Acyl-CoA thioesterase n=1 Tax=Striga asiatica TaxID=4170 RepID=A0A5A7QG04_STRAF|nr:acyl-CoA thioesterase [Striga asiatica]
MKPPRRTVTSHLLLRNPSTYSRNHEKTPFLIPRLSPPESAQSQIPSRTRLSSPKILPCPSLIPNGIKFNSTHLLNSLNQSKPTIKITRSSYITPENGSLFAKALIPIAKPGPISNPFRFSQMACKFAQNRSSSSAKSCPFASDSVPVVDTVSSPNAGSDPIDAGSSIRKPISLWPGIYHSPVTNALWEARSSIFERLSNAQESDPPQSELISKTPSKSRTSVLYKFSSDYILREQYRNPWNEIRLGKLLEDLDALAGTISFKHCSSEDSSTRPLILVTASVDKMVLRRPIRVERDLTIAGAVTWVGRSSMEIQLEVTQPCEELSDPSDALALTANFTFVARDSKTGKSTMINQISPETEKEKLLWEEAEQRNKSRKKKKGQQKKEISDEELKRLNDLLSEGRVFCDMPALADKDSILIKDTCLQNSLMCQPQQRNIHGRIFGGFLMRRAFELAFATAYSFSGSAPCFLEVDHVDFLKPVDVGNFLRFNSCVLFTELENPAQPMINVEVVAHVMRPEQRSSEVSNKFYFTFTINSNALKNGQKIRNVVPATEEEARRVIERIDAEKS